MLNSQCSPCIRSEWVRGPPCSSFSGVPQRTNTRTHTLTSCVAPKQAQRPRVREYAAQVAEMSSQADESKLATGDLKALEQEMAALVQERKVQVRQGFLWVFVGLVSGT